MVNPRWNAENASLKEKITDKMEEVSELRVANKKLEEEIKEARLKAERFSNSKQRLTVILGESVLGLKNSLEQMSVLNVELKCSSLFSNNLTKA